VSDELVREAREVARHERIAETRDDDPNHSKIAAVLTDLANALESAEIRYEATETARVRLVNAHAAALVKLAAACEASDQCARTVAVLDDLPDAVRRERLARGESIRSAARQIGVHFSILDRFEKRATAANLPTVKRMLAWLAHVSTVSDPTEERTT
jgi:ribosome-binding protein aMBF1 (putative translation factor)